MPETACAIQRQVAPAGDPSPQTCLQAARQTAILAVTAADEAMTAVCHSRAGAAARLETVMHAAHKEAVAAEKWADDPTMPSSAPLYCAREAVDHAVRAQSAAGAETTATDLRAELERKLTAAEYAERETERRREEAEREAEERAATGMDQENRDQAARNRHLAEGHVAGHVRVLEAAESGRLYWRDGRARLAARHGVWNGGRRISRERTEALFASRFLAAVRQEEGTRVLIPTPMGQAPLNWPAYTRPGSTKATKLPTRHGSPESGDATSAETTRRPQPAYSRPSIPARGSYTGSRSCSPNSRPSPSVTPSMDGRTRAATAPAWTPRARQLAPPRARPSGSSGGPCTGTPPCRAPCGDRKACRSPGRPDAAQPSGRASLEDRRDRKIEHMMEFGYATDDSP